MASHKIQLAYLCYPMPTARCTQADLMNQRIQRPGFEQQPKLPVIQPEAVPDFIDAIRQLPGEVFVTGEPLWMTEPIADEPGGMA